MAEAILDRYPTPMSLYRAYEASAALARRSNVSAALLATKVGMQWVQVAGAGCCAGQHPGCRLLSDLQLGAVLFHVA